MMETQWFDINTYGNPKKDGYYLVRAYNGWEGKLKYEVRGNYWHIVGYQSDIKEWAYEKTTNSIV